MWKKFHKYIQFTVYFRFVNVAMNIPLTCHFDAFDSPFAHRCQYFAALAISLCDDAVLASLPNLKSNTTKTQKIPAQIKWIAFLTKENKNLFHRSIFSPFFLVFDDCSKSSSSSIAIIILCINKMHFNSPALE